MQNGRDKSQEPRFSDWLCPLVQNSCWFKVPELPVDCGPIAL